MGTTWRFAGLTLDDDSGVLSRDGEPIALQPLGHRLLGLFLNSPGELFERHTLDELLWPDVVVGDESLTTLVGRLRRALGDASLIQTVPRRGYRFAADVARDTTHVRAHGAITLPPDRFFGREAELDALDSALNAGSRWVTLVGPGGAGKTRLALEWLARRAGGGARFVDLVGVHTHAHLVRAVGRALDPSGTTPAEDHLGFALASTTSVLVLDNAEQIAELLAERVRAWLTEAPELVVLCTSRIVLGSRSETVLTVDPLDQSSAIALFRARSGCTEDDQSVGALVDALDCLPLALELAAPRIRLYRAEGLLHRLEDRFALLRGTQLDQPERHRSLLAVLEDSWTLLDPPRRAALVQLSTFHSPFRLEDAQGLCGGNALDLLQGLVDHSLVQSRAQGRFSLLQTIRAWVQEQPEPHQLDAARDRHMVWFASFGEPDRIDRMNPDPHAPETRLASAAIDDLVAALRWALARRDAASALPLGRAMWVVLRRTGPLSLAQELLGQMLELVGDDVFAAVHAAGQAASLANKHTRALALGERMLELALAANNPRQEASARIDLAHAANGLGDVERSRVEAAGALAAARRAEHPYYQAIGHTMAASLARRDGDSLRAAEHAETAAHLYGASPGTVQEGIRLANLAQAHADRGDLAQAHEAMAAALARFETDENRLRQVEVGGMLARLQAEIGDIAGALVVIDRAIGQARQLGNPVLVHEAEQVRAQIAGQAT